MYLRPLAGGLSTLLVLRRAVCLSAAASARSSSTGAISQHRHTPAAPMHAITRDGKPSRDLPATEDAKSMLSVYPRGAYTTARTVDTRSVFEFEAHVERIAESSALMLQQSGRRPDAYPTLTSARALRPLLASSFRSCIQEFTDKYPDYRGEIRLTVLADWEEQDLEHGGFTLLCHGAPLPPPPSAPVVVEVRGHPRENALAKDSNWVKQRASLEALKLPAHDEIILPTEDGVLLEGTQTNFFAIIGGVVHTAGAGILEGTVRRLLLEVCAREKIPLVLSAPPLQNMDQWEGAMISSTSRLALPIDKIVVPQEGRPALSSDPCREFRDDALCRRIAELVRGQVRSHSEDVFAICDGAGGAVEAEGNGLRAQERAAAASVQ